MVTISSDRDRTHHSPDADPPLTGDETGVAATMRPMLEAMLGTVPVRFTFWDGTELGPADSPGTIHVRSADALRRIAWAPGELGPGRAFVAGDIDFEGDIFGLIEVLRPAGAQLHDSFRGAFTALRGAIRLGAFGRPLPPPPEETRPRGRLHSKGRDAEAVGHHYDVGNDFYRLILGESMTYSCARFVDAGVSLDQAQQAKHELVCRKLGLHRRRGMRLLDVGCGWGSMAMHAARHHGADVVGITISREQAALARERVAAAGLTDSVEIRLQDYRDLGDERFDVISSIGMFEHVGEERMADYFTTLRRLLGPKGRILNHAISSIGSSRIGPRTFVGRYVFPDGHLIDVGQVALAMEAAGFEVRDVESLREHYAKTLRQWVANLQEHWDDAVTLVGEGRARVWLLYMTGSAIGFEDAGLGIHQVLGVVTGEGGTSGMDPTRRDWD